MTFGVLVISHAICGSISTKILQGISGGLLQCEGGTLNLNLKSMLYNMCRNHLREGIAEATRVDA
jgi:hypothetical protein